MSNVDGATAWFASRRSLRRGRDCKICRAIIDKGCQIPDASIIGFEREYDLHLSPGGIVLVTPEMLGQHLHTGE